MSPSDDHRPLVAHVLYRLGIGGLENGVINLVNHMPADRFRHAVVALTSATDFRRRIKRDDVTVHEIHKRPGTDLAASWRLFRLFRQLAPSVVHTRNLGCLEAQVPALLAGVPCRVHGEHGWDSYDPHGDVRKYQVLRRLHVPLVQRFVPLSRELERYLVARARVPATRVRRIYNGVDTHCFQPDGARGLPTGFRATDSVVIGTVGRMHGVKHQTLLARAFTRLAQTSGMEAGRLRLVMIGDGPLRGECQAILEAAGLAEQAWLPGNRDDVPAILRDLDVFVLPSTAEGISNTILEAMASALPVIASDVGGNAELVAEGETGSLVPSDDDAGLAAMLARYVNQPDLRRDQGAAGRRRAEEVFSLDGMIARYAGLYDGLIAERAA